VSGPFQFMVKERRTAIRWAALCGMLLTGIAGGIRMANAQALPTAEASPTSTGFSLPTASGSLTYAVSASETLNWGFYSNAGRSAGTNVSGDLAYISNSKRDPFSAVLAGGHSFGTSGQPSYNFVSLGLSQVLAMRRWNFVVADSASVLPQTPSAGFAGIAGLGDLGVSTISLGIVPTSVVSQPAQGLLTTYATRVDNSVSASLERDITAKTGIHGSGSYSITRFTQNSTDPRTQGLDGDGYSAAAGFNHMFGPRNVMGANYSYSDFTYTQRKNGLVTPDFQTQTASIYYFHQFSRRLSLVSAAGPQWTIVDLGVRTTSLNTFANASLSYASENWRSSLSFVRATNSGYGVIGGALSNSASFTGSRNLSRVWAASASLSYSQSTSLPAPGLPYYTFHTAVAGGQISRALPHSLSMFASYTLQSQSNHGVLLSVLNAFSGHYQTLGFGLTYSPRAIHIGSR
jgi:hypothetical protein